MMAVCASVAGDFDHGVASMSKQQFSERLCAWIDQHFEEEVSVLQQLIRIPTDTPARQQRPARRCGGRAGAVLGLAGREACQPAGQVRDYGMQSITNLIVRRPYGDGGPTWRSTPTATWCRRAKAGPMIRMAAKWRMAASMAVLLQSPRATSPATSSPPRAGVAGRRTARCRRAALTYDEEFGGVLGPGWLLEQKLTRRITCWQPASATTW
jgi:hypothetical protein